jgi:hypothetical protein
MKKNGGFIFPALLLLFGLLSEIAAEAPWRIGYSVSINHPAIREDLLVPLAFSGIGLDLAFKAEWRRSTWSAASSVAAGMDYATNRFGQGSVIWPMHLQANIARDILATPSAGIFSLSIPLTASLNDRYIFSWDDAHLYWLTAHLTGLGLQQRRKISTGWSLMTWAYTPLVSLVSRPPAYRNNKQDPLKRLSYFFTRTNQDLTLAWPDVYRGLDAGVSFQHPLKHSTVALGLTYSYFVCDAAYAGYTGSVGLEFVQSWGKGK